MALPKKYDSRLKRNLGFRAVWLPGTKVSTGDIMEFRNGIFTQISSLSYFNIDFSFEENLTDLSLDFQAQGVRSTIIQANAEIDLPNLDPGIEAELRIEFNKQDTYYVKSPKLTGNIIKNVIHIGHKIKDLQNWNFKRYFIVTNVCTAGDFLFLGSTNKQGTVKLSGNGTAMKDLLTAGITTDLSFNSSKTVDLEIKGAGGALCMQVRRVKRNGELY